jgi:hypothetical protein
LIPAGKHSITWKFEPETYYSSNNYSMIGSIGLILSCLLIFGLNLIQSLISRDL